MKNCPNCNLSFSEGEEFCGQCGALFSEKQNTTATPSEQTPMAPSQENQDTMILPPKVLSQRKKNRKRSILVICVLTLLILTGTVFFYAGILGRTPKKPSPTQQQTIVVMPTGTPHVTEGPNPIRQQTVVVTPTMSNAMPTPALTSAPRPVNSISEEDFDNMTSLPYCDLRQWNSAWCTDYPSNIMLDTGNNGDTSPNSIKFVSTTKDIEMASPLVSVDTSKSYTVFSYLNLTITSNGFKFLVDEYDANKTNIYSSSILRETASTKNTVRFAYKPFSSNVRYARVQFVIEGGSGAEAYIDSFKWIENN